VARSIRFVAVKRFPVKTQYDHQLAIDIYNDKKRGDIFFRRGEGFIKKSIPTDFVAQVRSPKSRGITAERWLIFLDFERSDECIDSTMMCVF